MSDKKVKKVLVKVIAPNKKYSGKINNCQFDNGIGFTDNEKLLAYFKGAGYELDYNSKEGCAVSENEGLKKELEELKVENECLKKELEGANKELTRLGIEPKKKFWEKKKPKDDDGTDSAEEE